MLDDSLTPLMAKIISGTAGFIGGATFMAFLKPQNVWDAAVRSSISTMCAIVGSSPLLDYLELPQKIDYIVLSSVIVGFCSWSILTLAARTLLKVQDEKTEIKLPGFIKTK